MGGGQDKPAWTACPPWVKITRVGGKITRDSLPPRGQAVQGGKINCYTGAISKCIKIINVYDNDIKQNQWTIKYRSLTYIYLIRSIYVSHWSLIPTMMFIHQIILMILSKITRPWNIGHVDLYLHWGQSLGHTVSLSENMTLMHQILLEI